jgi:hypothetical protein
MPDVSQVISGFISNAVYGLAVLGLVLIWRELRKWRQRSPLRASVETHMVVDFITANALQIEGDRSRVDVVWRIEYELRNRGRAAISDIVIEWDSPDAPARLIVVDTLGGELSVEGNRVVGGPIPPSEHATTYFYLAAPKRPSLRIRTSSDAGLAHLSRPLIPDPDYIFYIFGGLTAIQAVASAAGGSAWPAFLFGLLAGMFFGISFGFIMVRRWRDREAIVMP